MKYAKKLTLVLVCTLIFLLSYHITVKANMIDEASESGHIAEDSNEKKDGKVRVGWYLVDGLHNVTNEKEYSGYDFDYLQAIAQYTNWEYEYVVASFSECIEMLKCGKIDLIGGVAMNEERLQYMEFSQFSEGVGGLRFISTETNTTFIYGDYSQLNGKKIGAINSSNHKATYDELCLEYQIKAEYITYESQEELLNALDNHSIDAALVSRTRNIKNYRIIGDLKYEDFYFATTKGNKELLSQLNYALNMIHQNQALLDSILQDKFFYAKHTHEIVFSKEELAYLQKNPKVTVYVRKERFPFESFNEKTGELSGIAYGLIRKVEELTGIQLVIQTRDIDVTNGTDLIMCFPYNYLWASKNQMRITKPYMTFPLVSVHKSKDTFGKKVGLLSNQYTTLLVQQQPTASTFEFCYYETMQDCFDALKNEEVDSVIANYYEADYYMGKDDIAFLDYRADTIDNMDACIGVSKKAPEELYSIIIKVLDHISEYDMVTIINDSIQIESKISLGKFVLTHPIEMFICLIILSIIFSIVLMMAYGIQVSKKKSNELLEASTAKTIFISRVSHDIRTPLNGILGMAQIGMEKSKEEETKNQFEKIKISGHYLLSLVNDVMDLAKIENNHFELQIMVNRTSQFFQELNSIIKPQIDQKQIKFELICEGEFDEYARYDRLRMLQIYMNLLGNAIKFSNPGGSVECICRNHFDGDMNRTILIVRDHGIGMKPEFMKRMFEPFEQENNQYDFQQEGSGLGLTIVQTIVRAMNGTIKVESQIGQGTEFTVSFELPRVRPEEVDAIFPKHEDAIENLSGKRILLVEDNEINSEIERTLLEQKEILVDSASNGEEAVEYFEYSELYYYDLILMDVRMPKMNGLVATGRIRSMNRIDAKTIPILAMTADTLNHGSEDAKKAGMNDYITKPINVDELYRKLCQYII